MIIIKPIDGDALRKKAREAFKDSEIGQTVALIIDELVDSAPELPVKHGFWIEQPGKIPYCSECGEHSDDADIRSGNYCQHCGAIMEENRFGYVSEGDYANRQYGKWKHQKPNAAFPWVCGVCGKYQCDNPIHFCPECKTDMKLPTFKRKIKEIGANTK